MNKKKINTEPLVITFSFKKIFNFFRKISLLSLVLGIFFICYKFTFNVFSNEYIINNFFEGKGYTQSCLNFIDSPDLLLELDNFYSDFKAGGNSDNVIPPVFFNNIPANFNNIKSIDVKKRVFINILLPIILKVEDEVEKERKKLLELSVKIVQVYLTDSDISFLDMMINKYNIPMNDNNFWDYSLALEELIKRVDIIPTSLVIAVAAQETGWGGSRFLIEANSLFSHYSWRDEDGIIPMQRKNGERNSIKKYSTLEASVRAFYLNLNTHKSYKGFRESRARMRGELGDRNLSSQDLVKRMQGDFGDRNLLSQKLAKELSKYSIEGTQYTVQLSQVLSNNKLTKYDGNKRFSTEKSVCITILR